MASNLIPPVRRGRLYHLAQRFSGPAKNKLRLQSLGSGQKLPELRYPDRVFHSKKRVPVRPWRIKGLQVAQPVRHAGLALNHIADKLRETLGEPRSEEHTSELQSRPHLVCRLLLEK